MPGERESEFYLASMAALESGPAGASCVGDNLIFKMGSSRTPGICSVWIDRTRLGLPVGPQIRPNRIVTSFAELRI